jgi:ferrous iron transport protein B
VLRETIAGRIGTSMEPIMRPLGFDWRICVALLGAFAAKEVFVSQLNIVFSLEHEADDTTSLRQAIRRTYDIPTAAALIVFLLIATPCAATIAVTRRESGSWKWAALQFLGLTALGYVLALAVSGIARLF